MCGDLYVIEKRNIHDYDMYFVLDIPVASDRDLVINITTSWDYKKGQCQINIKRKDSKYKFRSRENAEDGRGFHDHPGQPK